MFSLLDPRRLRGLSIQSLIAYAVLVAAAYTVFHSPVAAFLTAVLICVLGVYLVFRALPGVQSSPFHLAICAIGVVLIIWGVSWAAQIASPATG